MLLLLQGTLYQTNLTSGNQTQFLTDSVIGAPYAIAFDWVGRNIYIGNQRASNFKVIKVQTYCKKTRASFFKYLVLQ